MENPIIHIITGIVHNTTKYLSGFLSNIVRLKRRTNMFSKISEDNVRQKLRMYCRYVCESDYQ